MNKTLLARLERGMVHTGAMNLVLATLAVVATLVAYAVRLGTGGVLPQTFAKTLRADLGRLLSQPLPYYAFAIAGLVIAFRASARDRAFAIGAAHLLVAFSLLRTIAMDPIQILLTALLCVGGATLSFRLTRGYAALPEAVHA